MIRKRHVAAAAAILTATAAVLAQSQVAAVGAATSAALTKLDTSAANRRAPVAGVKGVALSSLG